MAPRLRRSRWSYVTGHLVTGLLVLLTAGPVSPTYAAEPDPAGSWAGSRAGEGRQRPGRTDPLGTLDPTAVPTAAADAEETEAVGSEPDVDPEPSHDAALPVPSYPARTGTAEKAVLEVLPLGSGLILVGLGLALTFVGLRIRRS